MVHRARPLRGGRSFPRLTTHRKMVRLTGTSIIKQSPLHSKISPSPAVPQGGSTRRCSSTRSPWAEPILTHLPVVVVEEEAATATPCNDIVHRPRLFPPSASYFPSLELVTPIISANHDSGSPDPTLRAKPFLTKRQIAKRSEFEMRPESPDSAGIHARQ